jgi:hypothetical protein
MYSGVMKMNKEKYQEALNNVKRVYVESDHYDEEDINLLQELVDQQAILEEYNVTPEILREVLLTGQMFRNQPTLDECIKEWEARGYELKIDKENKNLIILWNIQKLALFEIDLKYKRIKCKYQIPSRISYEIDKSFAYIDFDLIHLLSKTLKALEVDK